MRAQGGVNATKRITTVTAPQLAEHLGLTGNGLPVWPRRTGRWLTSL
jgi:hypothetical protein